MGEVIAVDFRKKREATRTFFVAQPMRIEWMMPAFFDTTFYESSIGFVDTAPSEMPPEPA